MTTWTKRLWLLLLLLAIFIISWAIYFNTRSSFSESHRFLVSMKLEGTPPTLIVHQSWKTKSLPPRLKKWSQSWLKCFPNAVFHLWDDKDNRGFIAQYYPWFLTIYDSYPKNIQRADAVRYFYLFHFGGLYVDLDTECLRPFLHLLKPHRIVLGAMSGGYKTLPVPEGHTQNSFMYSRPREHFWLEVIARMMKISVNKRPEESTGPDLLMKTLLDYRKRFKDGGGLKIYPPAYFNPMSWIKRDYGNYCRDFNVMSDSQLEKCRRQYLNGSYVIQYHAHMWGGGRIV